MIVAEFLGADAVVVPITCNDAIDRGKLAQVLEPKTRIGSPYVIAGMEAARAQRSPRDLRLGSEWRFSDGIGHRAARPHPESPAHARRAASHPRSTHRIEGVEGSRWSSSSANSPNATAGRRC